MIEVVIIDDEPAACTILETHIARLSSLRLLATLTDAVAAYEFLQSNRVDIVFTDINMPRISGIELAKNIPELTAIVFTTAYSEYALESYDRGAVDYLIKPVSFEHFLRSVTRASRHIQKQIEPYATRIDPGPDRFLELKVDGTIQQIELTDIVYIQSFGNFLKVFTPRRMILANGTIKNAEASLTNSGFIRCHRSFLVNIEYVTAAQNEIVLKNGRRLPIGYLYKRDVEKAAQNLRTAPSGE